MKPISSSRDPRFTSRHYVTCRDDPSLFLEHEVLTMSRTARILRFAVPALTLLAVAACQAQAITPTAPNFNNPYATDPLDPNMNPHYRTGVH
jgi:hypothetical protein